MNESGLTQWVGSLRESLACFGHAASIKGMSSHRNPMQVFLSLFLSSLHRFARCFSFLFLLSLSLSADAEDAGLQLESIHPRGTLISAS